MVWSLWDDDAPQNDGQGPAGLFAILKLRGAQPVPPLSSGPERATVRLLQSSSAIQRPRMLRKSCATAVEDAACGDASLPHSYPRVAAASCNVPDMKTLP
jgi:hypothetical protein